MSTWIVPELGTDFTADFEDTIIQYLYDKWSISDPQKDVTPQTEDGEKVSFKAGFPDYFRPYEICCVQTRTEPIEKINGIFIFTTGLDIMIRMKRLVRDAIDFEPQMENMETEIQRIVEHYIPNEITGIHDLIYNDQQSVQRVYNATDTYAKSDWRSVIRIKVFYQKDDLS